MIVRSVALAFALTLVMPGTDAAARTSPNPTGVRVLRPDGVGRTVASASAAQGAMRDAAPEATTAVVTVPLPAGAEAVDSTYYDLQDMGSLATRIVIAGDGTVHVAYNKDFCEIGGGCPPNPNAPDPYPARGMGYATRAAGVWTRLGKVQDFSVGCSPTCVPEHVGGFGSIALTATGQAAIAQHQNEDGCGRRGDLYVENTPGGSSWKAYLTPLPGTNPDVLEFPSATVNPNGSFTILAEDPRAGLYDEVEALRVSYLAAPGGTFTCPVGWQFGAWTAITTPAMFRDGLPAFPQIAASSNGRVGVAVGDFGGNVYLIESSNGTFAAGTITTRNLTNYSDATITKGDSTSTQYRPYIHCHLAYNDTTPHVVWSELQARKVGSVFEYHDFRSRIVHWDPVRGLEVVKQVAAGEGDRFDDVDQGLAGPLPGINTISVDWPQVGFSDDGFETYVAWLRFSDAEVDPTADMGLTGIVTGIGFGDIAASATRPGEAWGTPVNLTQTPDTDERFVSIAKRNPGGKVHIVFQAAATNQAGDAILGDRGPVTPNPPLKRRIAYLERALGGTVGVADPGARLTARTIVAFPNPSTARVRFSLADGGVPVGAALDVFTVSGRHLARVAVAPDGSFDWDGRDPNGARVAPGVYFARLSVTAAARPVQFMLIR